MLFVLIRKIKNREEVKLANPRNLTPANISGYTIIIKKEQCSDSNAGGVLGIPYS